MNSTNYNSLVKLASAAMAGNINPTRPTGPTNPATGGTRLTVKGGQPIGPSLYSNQIKGDLPITPYSSGKINIDTMRAASQQAANMRAARAANEAGKARNAQNLHAMFKSVHETNQQRRDVGLPDYVPTAKDVYAPNARTTAEYGEAENRMMNDAHSSAIAQEAARRGTPLNDAELYALPRLMPSSMKARQTRQESPVYDRQYMGVKFPSWMTPDNVGRLANERP